MSLLEEELQPQAHYKEPTAEDRTAEALRGNKVVEIGYVARAWAKEFHARKSRFSVLVLHRGAGKTMAAINELVSRALYVDRKRTPLARFAYIAPQRNQAKSLAWDYLKMAVADIPGVKVFESELKVVFTNNAVVRLFGADDPDSLRGIHYKGVILDEFGDMKNEVWTTIILPALQQQRGWCVFMGTPKGRNQFHRIWEKASSDKSWFTLMLKASVSKLISPEALAEAKTLTEPEVYEQEYECSFTAALAQSFFGKQIAALIEKGAIKHGKATSGFYDAREKVHVFHDPGHDDQWAMWFLQFVAGEVRVIDYWEQSGFDADEICEVLANLPYAYDTWWVPHDALHKTAQSKKSILNRFQEAVQGSQVKVRKVINPDQGNSVLNGISAVRQVLRTWNIVFDGDKCFRGLEALKNYSRKWDKEEKIFSNTPSHDRWSHGADAFRYLCTSIQEAEVHRSIQRAADRRLKEVTGINTHEKPQLGSNPITWNDYMEHVDRISARQAKS